MRLILASSSPRRLELLRQVGIEPDLVRPSDVDETPLGKELPRNHAVRVARAKLDACPAMAGALALAADTTVAAGRRILGKPRDAAQAQDFLNLLSGRRHRVFTAVVLRRDDTGQTALRIVESRVRMKRLSRQEIASYLDTDEWQGKAGAYAIQGQGARLIPWISGSWSAIIGLPLAETCMLLSSFGYASPRDEFEHQTGDAGMADGM